MKLAALAGVALFAAAPAFAQTGSNPPKIQEPGPPRVTTPGQPPEAVVQGGAGVANGGPASTGTLVRSGTGADGAATDTAASTNASNPSRAAPNVGGGGGDGGGSGN